ncbi:WG repeat-containing protein [Flammeovirga agarivorans]|uniref:WG repeat-containing protein n=1 Tax=Flammeovirga agarivorans TaxID=2726742 RepID=A0A7X8SIY8_9BACT|nr:WG repeat-containing protein [Flammeovirga agarivorans]NLR91002.1 WG repeat-containing protein [Flammeovirga agarivorans]
MKNNNSILFFLFSLLLSLGANAQNKALIPIEQNGLWGYCDFSRNIIIEPQFDDAKLFDNGLAIVSSNNKYGVINQEGNWVISNKYNEITSTLANDEFIVTTSKGKSGIIHTNGNKVLNTKYDSVFVFDERGDYLVFNKNQCGLYNTNDQNWILPVKYTEIAYDENSLLRITQANKIGFLNAENFQIVSEPQIIVNKTRGGVAMKAVVFDDWTDFSVVRTDGGYNILNKEGKVLLDTSSPQKIEEIDIELYNANGYNIPSNAMYVAEDQIFLAVGDTFEVKNIEEYKLKAVDYDGLGILQKGDKFYITNLDKTVSEGYDSLFSFNKDYLQGVNYNPASGTSTKSLVVINKKDADLGKEVVSNFTTMISYSNDDINKDQHWALVISDKNKQGIFDLDNKKYIIEAKYDYIFTPYLKDYGLIMLGDEIGNYAFYNVKTNKVISEMTYTPTVNTTAADKGILFFEKNGKGSQSTKVLDVYSIKENKLTGKVINGYDVKVRAAKGSLHFNPKHLGWETNLAYEFSEFAPDNFEYMYVNDHGHGEIGIGFLDKDFKELVPANYATVSFASEKEPYIKVTDFMFNEGMLSPKGEVVVPIGKFQEVHPISDGIIPVVDKNGIQHFLDKNGNELTVNN